MSQMQPFSIIALLKKFSNGTMSMPHEVCICSLITSSVKKKISSITLTKKEIVWSILSELKSVAQNFYQTTLCQASTG